jgi:hypothetical protein
MSYCSGFAVVFAVDVPDVPTVDNPPGKLPSRLCPSLLIRTCLMFQRLGINFALFTTTSPNKPPTDRSFYLRGHLPTKLCFESETNWTLLSFAVVTFRIFKSVPSLRLRNRHNSAPL